MTVLRPICGPARRQPTSTHLSARRATAPPHWRRRHEPQCPASAVAVRCYCPFSCCTGINELPPCCWRQRVAGVPAKAVGLGLQDSNPAAQHRFAARSNKVLFFLNTLYAPGLVSRESTPITSTGPARLTGSGSSARSSAPWHQSCIFAADAHHLASSS